ncbi:hypothetical protein [Aporhodopirellula aestuarii]|uniref:Secreted protein n=1 Tax=Aporhodopirellula aestuarii TaxID=2950107 RepID=A0ABT0TZU3_9BACT|nr:hypothetical protein [Aporhodopirellula aestuarii]MCM2370123.1 hypothetical protein [Aporhodopirellula aestuarii]
MIVNLVSRSSLLSILLGCSLFSLGMSTGCGNSANDVPEVTMDEIADYEKKLAEAQAKANAEEAK